MSTDQPRDFDLEKVKDKAQRVLEAARELLDALNGDQHDQEGYDHE